VDLFNFDESNRVEKLDERLLCARNASANADFDAGDRRDFSFDQPEDAEKNRQKLTCQIFNSRRFRLYSTSWNFLVKNINVEA